MLFLVFAGLISQLTVNVARDVGVINNPTLIAEEI
jgi:hypothetical protein